jgi:hypothetical protein
VRPFQPNKGSRRLFVWSIVAVRREKMGEDIKIIRAFFNRLILIIGLFFLALLSWVGCYLAVSNPWLT